jgi:hypothetical protein
LRISKLDMLWDMGCLIVVDAFRMQVLSAGMPPNHS